MNKYEMLDTVVVLNIPLDIVPVFSLDTMVTFPSVTCANSLSHWIFCFYIVFSVINRTNFILLIITSKLFLMAP